MIIKVNKVNKLTQKAQKAHTTCTKNAMSVKCLICDVWAVSLQTLTARLRVEDRLCEGRKVVRKSAGETATFGRHDKTIGIISTLE